MRTITTISKSKVVTQSPPQCYLLSFLSSKITADVEQKTHAFVVVHAEVELESRLRQDILTQSLELIPVIPDNSNPLTDMQSTGDDQKHNHPGYCPLRLQKTTAASSSTQEKLELMGLMVECRY
ncbi:hypothetical protein ElyMa_001137200 [Elysia marginata]|uniref:Uncharacterized protein n=1 Tax=Elysia marginata TaxID=1093978 RepID=A0AAV4I1X1_9GAST|nr:hypothetical protein ElyMa_001137200 [Elysia marginata]